jgi:hypothetical protein
MSGHNIFYYPYASIEDVGMLKRALLYFDKIVLLDPSRATTEDLTLKPSTEWDCAVGKLGSAIIERIEPHENIGDDYKVIADNVQQDLDSEEFWDLCGPYCTSQWLIASSKIPDDFERDTRLRQLLIGLPNYVQSAPHAMPAILEAMKERRFVEERVPLREALREVGPGFGPDRQHAYRSLAQVAEERAQIADQPLEYRLVPLPFPIGESLMVNHVLRIMEQRPDVVPFTDDKLHDQFLRWKYTQLAQRRVTRSLLQDADLIRRTAQANLTAVRVLTFELPDMTQASFDQILELREHRQPELEAFRTRMQKLAADIERNYWEDSFAAEVARCVAQEIDPELNSVKASFASLKGAKWRWLTDAGTGLMSLSSTPLVFSVLPGMPIGLIIALAGGMYALDSFLDTRKAKAEHRRNGVTFLLHAQNLAARVK